MSFETALPITLKFEGGYSDNPDDPGGATNFGITQGTYDPTDKKSVKDITPDQVHEIYYNNYWLAAKCDLIANKNLNLATAHFDMAVNTGTHQAALTLQRAVSVTPDGIIGPETLNAINSTQALVDKYLDLRLAFYQELIAEKPNLAVWDSNWTNRVNTLRRILDG